MHTRYETIFTPLGQTRRLHTPVVPSIFTMKKDLNKYIPVFKKFKNQEWVKKFKSNPNADNTYALLYESLLEIWDILPSIFPLNIVNSEIFENEILVESDFPQPSIYFGLDGTTTTTFFDATLSVEIGPGDFLFHPGGCLFKPFVDTTHSTLLVGYLSSST